MTMDTDQRIKILVGDCLRAREACQTSDATFVGQLQGMAEAALQISADLEQARRSAAAEKARLKSEMDRGRAEENDLHLRIKEARKTLEKTIKENDHQRAVGRAMFASIA
jgi:hypothetical protein